MQNWILAFVFLTVVINTASARVSRYDEFQGSTANLGNVQISGNTIEATNTNGDLVLKGNGTGKVQLNSPVNVSDDGQGSVSHTISGASVASTMEIHQTSGTEPGGLAVHRHIDSASFGAHYLGFKSRGSHDTPTVVQLDDALARFVVAGYDGTDYEVSSEIRMSVDGTPADSATDMPGRIGFFVSPDGSSTAAEAVRISEDKSLSVSDGTVSVPGVNFLSDEDTGAYRSGADTLDLVAGGALGLQVKKTSGFVNVGLGGANASTSESYPILLEHTLANTLNMQISNPSSDAAAAAGFQLKTNAGANTSEVRQWTGSAVVAYGTNLVLRSTDSSTGISFVADGAADQDFHFYSGGVAAANEVVGVDANGLNLPATKEIRFEDTSGGEYVGFKAPGTVTASTTFTLPDGDGINGQALKTDGAGTLSWGAAAGGGSVNYHDDFDCDNASGKVSAYDDVSAATDLTGGTPNVTVSSETSAPIAGTASYKLSKDAADRQHEGWSIDSDSLDEIDTDPGQAVWVNFSYKTSANYAANDVEIYVYRVGSNTLEACNSFQGSSFTNVLPVAPNGARYSCWVTPSSSDTSLRVGFHQASTNANAVDIYVDRLTIGPSAQVQTAIQSDWESYTPTWTNLTVGNATQTFKWRRVGDSMEISGHFLWGSTTSGSGTFEFSLPSGYSVDNTKARSTYARFGTAWLQDSGVGVREVYRVVQNATNARFFASGQTNAGTSGNVGTTFPFTWATNDEIDVLLTVPISGWSSGNAMSTAELSVRSVGVKATNTAGTSITTSATTVPFATEAKDSHNAWDGSVFTAPVSGTYKYAVSLASVGTLTASYSWFLGAYKEGSTAVGAQNKAGTGAANTWNAVNVSGSVELAAGETLEFKSNLDGGSAIALITGAGYNQVSIDLEPDLSVIGLQGVFDVTGVTSSKKTPSATGHWHNLTGNSKTLGPGTYTLSASADFANSGISPTYSQGAVGIFGANGADNGTAPALLSTLPGVTILGNSTAYSYVSININDGSIASAPVTIRVTQPTTVYVVTWAEMTTAANARITAYMTVDRRQ